MPTRVLTLHADEHGTQAMRLGQALRARRKALGISMAAAAETARISRVTWHRLEKGEATVALGSLLAAMEVLGLALRAEAFGPTGESTPPPADALPVRIRLQDYPGLQRLAWQVGEGLEALTPREALGLYQRNGRHLDQDRLEPREKALIHALHEVLGGGPDGAGHGV